MQKGFLMETFLVERDKWYDIVNSLMIKRKH